MPATAISTQSVSGPYPALPVTAASLDLAFSAADTTNGNLFTADTVTVRPEGTIGGDILLAWNTDSASHHITITSAPDDKNRSGDIANYVVGAGVISAFSFSQITGWASGGDVNISSDSALVKFAILKR